MRGTTASNSIAAPRSQHSGRSYRTRFPWPSDRIFRILSIDGGGIRGVFPAAVLAGLERKYLAGDPISRYFDLVTGTSTGGILALGMSLELPAAQLLDLYRKDGKVIFPPGRLARWRRTVRACALYRYDRRALTRVLERTLASNILAESKVRLCIPAFEGHHGEVYIFKTPHHPDYRLDGGVDMVTIAQATAAAPTYFRAVDSGGYRFVDGGVWANNPAMIGLVDAMACFDLHPRQVRILSLGCGREPARVGRIKAIGGLIAWKDAIFAAMDLQCQNANGQAGLLIGADNFIRIEPQISSPIRLDDWRRSSAELPMAATDAVAIHGQKIASEFLHSPVSKPQFYWPTVPTGTEQVALS